MSIGNYSKVRDKWSKSMTQPQVKREDHLVPEPKLGAGAANVREAALEAVFRTGTRRSWNRESVSE